jgi:hypothetical protein
MAENYGAIKTNKFVGAICPIIFTHGLADANFAKSTLTKMRIFEGGHSVLIS